MKYSPACFIPGKHELITEKNMILKSCPFCGGQPYLEEAQRGYVNGQSTHVCFVRCKKCNARSNRIDLALYGKTAHSEEAIAEAAKSWNARVYNSEIDQLYEATHTRTVPVIKMQLKEGV